MMNSGFVVAFLEAFFDKYLLHCSESVVESDVVDVQNRVRV